MKKLILAAILITGAYTYAYKHNIFCRGLLSSHGEIAYNVYKYNSVKINPSRRSEMWQLQNSLDRRAEYYEIDHKKHGPPTEYRNYFDSIGYGVALGLLWKITGSLSYFDIQILQMLMFLLMMLLFYQIGIMLFDRKTAYLSCIALLAFTPLLYLNAQAFRDIWPFYSGVILAYVSLSFLLRDKSWLYPALGGAFIALFQFMRPASFTFIMTMGTVLFFSSFFTKQYKKTFLLIFILITTNIMFFWAPFMSYNKKAYNRYFVSPVCINMLVGLGEFKNKWGYSLSDGWYANFMEKNYPDKTWLERDDIAKEIFYNRVKENPFFYLTCIMRRIPRITFPGFPSFNYQDTHGLYTMYVNGTPIKDIFKLLSRSPIILWDFFIRHIYIGLYLLLAYLGMFMALVRKKYFAVSFLFLGLVAAGYPVILSHTEHRYLIPYYGFFPLFVGYFFSAIRRSK